MLFTYSSIALNFAYSVIGLETNLWFYLCPYRGVTLSETFVSTFIDDHLAHFVTGWAVARMAFMGLGSRVMTRRRPPVNQNTSVTLEQNISIVNVEIKYSNIFS